MKTERDEAVGRGAGALMGLVAAFNSLPPGLESEFSCPSGEPLGYLIDLRYADKDDALVEAEYHSCDIARTEDHYWEASEDLREELDGLLEG
jgi:hypothetical protein